MIWRLEWLAMQDKYVIQGGRVVLWLDERTWVEQQRTPRNAIALVSMLLPMAGG